MNEPTGRDRRRYTLELTLGAVRQVTAFMDATGIETFTEAVEAMVALAAASNLPERIARAIRAQEAIGYRR